MARPTLTHDQASDGIRSKGFEPLEPYPGARADWRVQCLTCPRTLTITRDDIVRPKKTLLGCSDCVLKGRASRARLRVSAKRTQEMVERGATPRVPYPGTDKPWECTCNKCGEVITPRYNNLVVHKQRACRFCSPPGGYKVHLPGYLYLMERDYYGVTQLQIGITNDWSRREKEHRAEGWRALDVIGPVDGKDALHAETKLCAVIAERGWLLRNRKERWEVTNPDKHLTSLAEVFASTGVRTVT